MIRDKDLAFDAAISPAKLLGMGLGPCIGETYYVCKSSLAQYNWLRHRVPGDRIFKTLLEADTAMVDSANSRCLIMPGHTESNATEIPLTCIGAEFIGLGRGNLRPTYTTTGAVNCISLDAANQTLMNVGFAAPGIDTVEADIDVVGAGCQIIGTWHQGSGNTNMNKVDLISLTATANDTLIDGMRAYNTVVELTGGAINFQGACSRVEISNAIISSTAFGYALGAIYDGATALNVSIHHCYIANCKAATVVLEFGNNTTGLVADCFVSGRHTTIASNISCGTGMAFYNCLVVEEHSKNALAVPALDAE